MSDVPNEFKETATGLAEKLQMPYSRVCRWIERSDVIGFPAPVDQVGKYKFYDIRAVESWLELWTKATKGMRKNA